MKKVIALMTFLCCGFFAKAQFTTVDVVNNSSLPYNMYIVFHGDQTGYPVCTPRNATPYLGILTPGVVYTYTVGSVLWTIPGMPTPNVMNEYLLAIDNGTGYETTFFIPICSGVPASGTRYGFMPGTSGSSVTINYTLVSPGRLRIDAN